MVAAGGTGGHVFPALAVARELVKQGAEVLWLGRQASLEQQCAGKYGIGFQTVPASGFSGMSLGRKLRSLSTTLVGVVKSVRILSFWQPDALVACGGYVSLPPLMAAVLCGKPYFLLEQNRVPGRVTRLFLKKAKECFYAFPPAVGVRGRMKRTDRFPEKGPNWQVCGNPLREEMFPTRREDDGRTVLVLGGSGGARALTLAALDTAAALANLHFIVVTGRRDFELAKTLVRSRNVELVEFTERPEELYRRATIAVSRAGGMVLSELTAFGIPAILVPFPHATDRHQEANAYYLESVGAAMVLDQGRLSGLTSVVSSLLGDEERRRSMQQAALAVARPDAARVIVGRILDLLGTKDVRNENRGRTCLVA